MKEDDQVVVVRQFERINNMMECKSYNKYENVSENKEIFIHGFKHIKADEFDKYIIFGSESDNLYENDKVFNFWSIKFINEEIQKR